MANMIKKIIPQFCVPTPERNVEIDHAKSIAHQEFDELNRQAQKQNKTVSAGHLIPNDELNNALDANS